ncbi:MAG TPA: hypothetical protein DEB06_02960, partial [Phycisphaerales bacterium]|nr:hypothetical protein [Phycisphaerales bacterium]
DQLGGGATAPRTRPVRPEDESSPTQNLKRPPSTNPGAGQLSYIGSPADRENVLARLDSYAQFEAGARRLSFEETLRVAQESSREYVTAEEEYLLAAIRLLIERHRWGPRFFNDLSTVFSGGPGDAGRYATALSIVNEFRATQRLPYGGEFEAALITRAASQLTEVVGERNEQSSSLVLSAEIPLLRDAGLIAQEDLIQAERDLVYAARTFEDFRRAFFVDIARDYFALLAQRAVIRNQEARLESVIKFYEQTRALVEAGRSPPFQARNVEQNVLSSRDGLISQRERYILDLDRFKIRLGLPTEAPIALEPISLTLDDPDITVEEAVRLALDYRLDFQNAVDRVDDARRDVKNARNQLLPDLDATASASFNTDEDRNSLGLNYDLDDTTVSAGVTFGLPLDREIERLQLRQAIIGLQRQIRDAEEFRDQVVLDARQGVREIDRARFSLRLQEQTVAINELRLEELRIKADEVDAQTRLDAENELLQSRNNRDAAERDLRTAILDYLRVTGQLRVKPSGNFQPLQGMLVRAAESTAIDPATQQALPETLPPGPGPGP